MSKKAEKTLIELINVCKNEIGFAESETETGGDYIELAENVNTKKKRL